MKYEIVAKNKQMIEVNDLVRFSNEALRLIIVRGGKHRLMRGRQRISRVTRILSNSYRYGQWQRIVELDCVDNQYAERFMRISVEWLVLYKKAKKEAPVAMSVDWNAVDWNAIVNRMPANHIFLSYAPDMGTNPYIGTNGELR